MSESFASNFCCPMSMIHLCHKYFLAEYFYGVFSKFNDFSLFDHKLYIGTILVAQRVVPQGAPEKRPCGMHSLRFHYLYIRHISEFYSAVLPWETCIIVRIWRVWDYNKTSFRNFVSPPFQGILIRIALVPSAKKILPWLIILCLFYCRSKNIIISK